MRGLPQDQVLQVSRVSTMAVRYMTAPDQAVLYSVPCSKADWPKHKEVCFSEKRINAMLDQINAAEEAKPKPRPSKKSCTGCGVKFTEHDSDNEDEDEESEDALADACDECGEFTRLPVRGLLGEVELSDSLTGYMCCESCISDTSNGKCCFSALNFNFTERLPSGSCHCHNSNFGSPYCSFRELQHPSRPHPP